MIIHRAEPLNAETPPTSLAATFITPQAELYIRAHGSIPQIDAETYRLRVSGLGLTSADLPLGEIRSRFAERHVEALMQCAGNRRADMLRVKPVTGDPWGPGAIGNARWTGVALRDVLEAADLVPGPGLHVVFACHDEIDEEGEQFRYEVSIPLEKALAPETLLAYAMNGEPLTPEHGFPLRLVTPGYAGVRSPKWLASIKVQDRPSGCRIQQKSYKLLPADAPKEHAGVTINAMPLTSAICEPASGTRLPAGPTLVRGYAAANCRRVVRVDVSADGGANWQQADLDSRNGSPWSWTLWSTRMTIAAGDHEFVVRAWDEAGQTQPSSTAELWNRSGYLSAAWHRVKITAE